MSPLRSYQQDAVEALRKAVGAGKRSPLLVCPTGSGKTLIAREVVSGAIRKGNRVLFLAPRRELIYQTQAKLVGAGIEHGIIMAGEDYHPERQVQLACIPTLIRRQERIGLPNVDLVIIDESHIGVGGEAQKLIQSFPCIKIGMTATPARADGKGLGAIYDDMVMGPRVAELTKLGYLVPCRYYAPSKPDLAGVKITAGDYNQKQLEERVNKPTLIGDVVTNWARIAPTRRTLVFAVTVAHSMALRDAFQSIGIKAEHLDGETPHDERALIIRRFKTGETQVLVNCEIMTYGVDIPEITCGVLAKPTKSIARFLQMAGRLLRPHDGKQDVILIDHAGAVEEIGFVDDEFEWTLDGKSKVRKSESERHKPKPILCSQCKHVYEPAPSCPMCGHVPERTAKPVETIEHDLTELSKTQKRLNREWTAQDKRRFYGELKFIERERGYRFGWASQQYRTRIGVWPNAYKDAPMCEPSLETYSWVKSRAIAFAKSRKNPHNMEAST